MKKGVMGLGTIAAFVLGALLLFAIVALVAKTVPVSKVLAYFGLNVIQQQEERSKVDRTFTSFERAYDICKAVQGNNCVCDYPINIELGDSGEFEVVPVQGKTDLRMAGYSTTIDAEYCALRITPREMANWHYIKHEPWNSSILHSELLRFVPAIADKNKLHIEMGGIFEPPYHLVKWDGKICFAVSEETLTGRTCNQLQQCKGVICNESEFCKGGEDPFYIGKDKCCALGCSDKEQPVTADDVFAVAEQLEKAGQTDEAITHYKRFVENYLNDARAPNTTIKVADMLMLQAKESRTKYLEAAEWYSRVVRYFPENRVMIEIADKKSIEAYKGAKMDCDSWTKPPKVLSRDKESCLGRRYSLLTGCYFNGNDCVSCAQTRCSDLDEPMWYSCENDACINVGDAQCRKEATAVFFARCTESSRALECSDIKNSGKCIFDPCIRGEGKCCLWNVNTDKCEVNTYVTPRNS